MSVLHPAHPDDIPDSVIAWKCWLSATGRRGLRGDWRGASGVERGTGTGRGPEGGRLVEPRASLLFSQVEDEHRSHAGDDGLKGCVEAHGSGADDDDGVRNPVIKCTRRMDTDGYGANCHYHRGSKSPGAAFMSVMVVVGRGGGAGRGAVTMVTEGTRGEGVEGWRVR